MKDPGNPYADYTVDDLYEFLSSYTLPRDPGSEFEYSNVGAGLLGGLLARRAGSDYESLIRSRVSGTAQHAGHGHHTLILHEAAHGYGA